MFYQCGNCRYYLQQSEMAGICTNCECRYFGDNVGSSESCNKWCQNDEKHKLRPPTKAESLCIRCFHNNACSSVLKEHLLIEELMCRVDPVCKDFVEIIRCKECENYQSTLGKDSGKPCGYGICINKVNGLKGMIYDEDFCPYGKRSAPDKK